MAETMYRIDPATVASRRVGNESVVLDLRESVYFGLNRIGGELWERLLAGATLDDLVQCLRAHFPDVDHQQARDDVESFLWELRAQSLINAD